MKMRKYRASVLVITLLAMSIVLATALSVSLVVVKQRQSSLSAGRSNTAFQNADTGVERVMNDIQSKLDGHLADLTNFSAGKIVSPGGEYAVELMGKDGKVMINGTDEVINIARIKSVGKGANKESRAIEAAVASCDKSSFNFKIDKTSDWSAQSIIDSFSTTNADTFSAFYIALADVNNDKLADLFIGGTSSNGLEAHIFAYKNSGTGSGTTRWVRQNGSGGSENWEKNVQADHGMFPPYVRVADVNGDGRKDLVTSGSGNHNVFIYLNDGSGSHPSWSGSSSSTWNFLGPAGLASALFVAAADINSDDKTDILAYSKDTNQFYAYRNTGSGFVSAPLSWTTGIPAGDSSHKASNMDMANPYGGGQASLFIIYSPSGGEFDFDTYANTASSGAVTWTAENWYRSVCNDSGGVPNHCPGTIVPGLVAVGDVDGDGSSDIAFLQDYSGNKIRFFKNICH